MISLPALLPLGNQTSIRRTISWNDVLSASVQTLVIARSRNEAAAAGYEILCKEPGGCKFGDFEVIVCDESKRYTVNADQIRKWAAQRVAHEMLGIVTQTAGAGVDGEACWSIKGC